MAGINTGDKLERLTGKERLGAHRDSEYLGTEDIDPGTEPVLTIEGIWWGKVTTARGKEDKDVISFVEDTVPGIYNVRPWIVNSTNRKALKKLYKSVTADVLQGKRIQLYVDHNVRDPETGGKTDGIRIRPIVPAAPAAKEAPVCEACKKPVTGSHGMTAEQVAAYTLKKYQHVMCAECAERINNAKKENEAMPESPVAPSVETVVEQAYEEATNE